MATTPDVPKGPSPGAPLFGGILRGEVCEHCGYVMPSNPRSELVPLHLNENLFEVEGALPVFPADRETLSRYPLGGSRPLIQALADHFGLEPEAVFVNAGACAVLNAVFSMCANVGAVAVLPSPTWSYYHEVLGGLGVMRVEVPQRLGADGYRYDVAAIAECAASEGATMVVLTSPNNPTGNRVGYDEVRALAQRCPGSLVILDEAYFGFAPPDPMRVAELVSACPNVVVVRTFSKALGLACLRVGFALAGIGARVLLRRLPVPFGLAGYAQEFAIARLADHGYHAAVQQAWRLARDTICEGLSELDGFFVYPSDANFVLVRTPPGRARAIRDHLAERGFLVKLGDCAEMPDHLRITLAEAPIMERVLALVREL